MMREVSEYMNIEIDLGKDSADYENIRPLDQQGGMGDIFFAHKKGLNVDVVIKRVKKEFRGRLDQKNEAEILKGLKHQYLPRIYDIIEGKDGYIYTVMDYIQGDDLQNYVNKHGCADQKSAHRWACQLCEVVSYLHAQTPPIIHCDIKPHNIMITPAGDICLIDFNTSLIFEDGQMAIGKTRGYAAPEQYLTESENRQMVQQMQRNIQNVGTDETEVVADNAAEFIQKSETARGVFRKTRNSSPSFSAVVTSRAGGYGRVTIRTDLYAIGATLYFAVSGHAPEKSLDPVTDLAVYHTQISLSFLQIIRRAMEKQPENRFANAQEMLHALQDVYKIDKRYQDFQWKKRLTYIVLLVVLGLGAASTYYGWIRMQNENTEKYLTYISDGERCDQSGEYERGEAAYREAIAMAPSNMKGYTGLAVLLYHQGRYQEAIDLFANSIKAEILDAKNSDRQELGNLYYITGSCYYELKDYDRARNAYELAREQDNRNTTYIRSLAMAEAKCGNLSEAQGLLDEMVTEGAIPAECNMIRAEIAELQGDNEQAASYYEQVIAESDDMQLLGRAYVEAAQLYEQENNTDAEIQLLESAVSKLEGSQKTLLYEMLAGAYSNKAASGENTQEYYSKAKELLQDLIDSGYATFVTRINLAAAEQGLGEYENAEQVLKDAREAYPQDYRADMRLAYLYAKWQEKVPVESRNYQKVQTCYESAWQKYQTALANGQEDQDMTLLKNLIVQLQNSGWLN